MRWIGILLFLFQLTAFRVSGQIRVDHSIILSGAEVMEQQVHGVLPTLDGNAILGAGQESSGTHRYAAPAANNIWQVELQALEQAPIPGTHVLLNAPGGAEGPVQIMLNENGPYPLTFGEGQPVTGGSIPEGMILSLIYDGEVLQLMNDHDNSPQPCPAGSVSMNDQFCMQIQPHAPLDFFDAVTYCGALHMRLCTWGEIHLACVNAEVLGVEAIGATWEWTSSNANEDTTIRMVRGCYEPSTSFTTVLRQFRCCLSR